MDEIFMNFKDQNHFLNYICFIFIHFANKAFQITVKTPATKQIINLMQFTSKFSIYPSFSDRIQTGFTAQLPSKTSSGTWRKIRHALPDNSAHTYARTPLDWVSQNYTLCPCWSRRGNTRYQKDSKFINKHMSDRWYAFRDKLEPRKRQMSIPLLSKVIE